MTQMMIALSLAVFLLSGDQASAECPSVPPYRVGRVWELSAKSANVAIAIAPADFAPPRLVCLAARLKARYAGRTKIVVMIFGSKQAAENWGPGRGDIESSGDPKAARLQEFNWLDSQLHALYTYDAVKREEEIVLKPTGKLVRVSHDTVIPLPLVGSVPHCKLELSGRCVLFLDDPIHLASANKERKTTSVTLSGSIAIDGTVKGIKVEGDKSESTGFDQDVSENFGAWRFAPSHAASAFTITYAYVVDPSLPSGGVDVQFELPRRIVIRVRPPQ
jgi:hypothetical protein